MIVLEIQFHIDPVQVPRFVEMYRSAYVPALQRQKGYQGSQLLRTYAPELADQIGTGRTPFEMVMQLRFETEALRQLWAASDDHEVAWARALEFALDEPQCIGFDVVGGDGS